VLGVVIQFTYVMLAAALSAASPGAASMAAYPAARGVLYRSRRCRRCLPSGAGVCVEALGQELVVGANKLELCLVSSHALHKVWNAK
jgi:hypothetical protein